MHIGDSIQDVVKAGPNHVTSPISAAEQLIAPETLQNDFFSPPTYSRTDGIQQETSVRRSIGHKVCRMVWAYI